MPRIQYAFRDDAKSITLLTQGSTAACPLCQIVALRKREISPEFLGHFMVMDIKGTSFPATAVSDYGRELEHTKDSHRYYAVIDSQIEFTVKPRTMQKLEEFIPAYKGTGLYNFFEGQTYGYLIVLKVYASSQYIPNALLVKGRKGSAQIIHLYDEFGERTQVQIADDLQPLIDPGTFDYIKYEILHTLRVENALIGVYGTDEDSRRLLKQKRDDYNDETGQYKRTFNEDVNVDRSQVDYEETYSRVVELAPSLADFIEYVRNVKPPQMVECQAMLQRVRDGDQQAKHRIVEMYLRNIIRSALFYAEKYQAPIEDIIQDGIIGMMSAIEKYDTSEAEAFQHYYPLLVRQGIQRELPHYLYVRYVPMYLHERLLQIREYAKEQGYNLPEDFELITSEFMASLPSELVGSESRASEYLQQMVPEISFEDMLENKPTTLRRESSLIVDSIDGLIETLSHQQLHYALEAAMATLTPREAEILRLRNGFGDGKVRTLEEVGKEYNITRERIRQIEQKALQKMRHPSRSKKVKCYLDCF